MFPLFNPYLEFNKPFWILFQVPKLWLILKYFLHYYLISSNMLNNFNNDLIFYFIINTNLREIIKYSSLC